MSDAPPPVSRASPQQAPLPTSAPSNHVPVSATLQFTLQQLHGISINREKLSEWHHKIRARLFPLVSGMYVRCRIEDANDGRALYKVGRVKSLKSDWSVELDLLTSDEMRVGKNHTNYDCISNTKINDTEWTAWVTKLPQESMENVVMAAFKTEERLRIIESILLVEPAFHAKKKKEEEKKDADPYGHLPEKYVFSQNVLLVDDGDQPNFATIMEILTNAVGKGGVAEPDTPRAMADMANRPKPKSFDEAVASNSTVVSLADVKNYIQSPTTPLPDPARVIEILRRAAQPGNTEFSYDNVGEFAKVCLNVCHMARDIVAKEPLYLQLKSPMVVFGDIHGNYADMMFFLKKIVAFDDIMLKYTTTNLLFLGDYVDRGPHGVECIMFLLALKVLAPKKVSLLRGNHESPEVNGDIDVYGYSSFKYQCLERFGRDRGMEVWVAINEVFQYLPVIANVDKKIFCVHGGLPQYSGGDDRRLEILADPTFPRIPVVQCADMSNVAQRMIVNDLLWSDPAGPGAPVDQFGFGPNPRGPDIKTFGAKAVDMFCERYGFQYIFRAHQEKADGLRVSDSARVVTIFSTSDYAGHQNGAGCVLIADGKIRMAIKKPKPVLADPPGRLNRTSPGAGLRGTSPKRR